VWFMGSPHAFVFARASSSSFLLHYLTIWAHARVT
jgi:hypothetical protein